MDALLEADVRDALTRFAHDAPATLARPSVIVAARSRRRRRAATVTTGTAVVLVAVAAAGFAWALPGQGQDRLQPARAAQSPPLDKACVDQPPAVLTPDGSLIPAPPGPGMPAQAWDVIVAEAPVPPSGPRPGTDGERVTFGTYTPTQHGYATNTEVPLPPSAALFEVSGQVVCDGSNLVRLGTLEGTSQGWPAGVQAGVIDARPSFYQLVLQEDDAVIIFYTQNMETSQPVEQLRDWAMRVAERLSVTG